MATRSQELRGEALRELPLDQCSICTRGREACAYCHDIDERDWEAICDCGLLDFGRHLVECKSRESFKWIIAPSPAEALIPRAKGAR